MPTNNSVITSSSRKCCGVLNKADSFRRQRFRIYFSALINNNNNNNYYFTLNLSKRDIVKGPSLVRHFAERRSNRLDDQTRMILSQE